MSFIDEDDDGFNVSQIKSSKLSTLFSSTFIEDEDANQTLKYVPPKQPKTIEIPVESNTSKENRTQTVIHAVAVNAYKFENQQYRAVGCVGCALISNNTQNFKLVLYTGKQQYICYATLNYEFAFTVQPNKYGSFYDDKTTNWSLLFADDKSLAEMARKIAFCKAQSLSTLKLICQDIRMESSDGAQVEANDSIELKYKAWTVEELNKLGTLFDSSETSESKRPFRFKLCNKGGKWQEMLTGMRAGSHRFCLIPVEFKDDFSGIVEKAVLYESTVLLAFEVELIRIKPRDPKEQPQRQRADTTTSIQSQDGERRSNSVSSICVEENVEINRRSSKSDILSRVAKVGTQIIIPPKSKVSAEEEEAVKNVKETNTGIKEIKEVKDTPKEEATKVKPLPKPRLNSISSTSTAESAPVSQPQSVYSLPSSSTYRMNQPAFAPYGFNPLPADNSVNRIMSEMHSNYSELRLNLCKITDKLESITNKVDGLQSINKIFSSATTIGMDSTLLLASIQRIVNDNNALKSEVEEKNSKLDKLNEKICELLSHQFKEQREDKSADLNAMNKRLQEDLQRALHEIESIQREKEIIEKENNLLKSDKQLLNSQKDEITSQLERLKKNTTANVSKKDIESKIKKIMNVLYRTVVSNVDQNEENSLTKQEVVELLANAIRVVTLEALESGETNSPQRSPFHNSNQQATRQAVVTENECTQPKEPKDDKLESDEIVENSQKNETEAKSENEELVIESDNKSNVELSNSEHNEVNNELLKWKPTPPSPPVFTCSDEDDENDKWLS